MLLKSLNLKNIRSYEEEEIVFPEGSVLLAGDIGAGKSTILLAIEFALFGLLRGEVDGAALLRNGTREGYVQLTAEIENKEFTIRRVLKKRKERIAQESGYILQNGVRKDGTAQELKAWVLHLLGYPPEFLTKSKNLLYRYTVFTPQEEMKRILFEDKDARLETLRRVFDVDKYKRIKENSNLYVKEIKEERKRLEGVTQDLVQKKTILSLKQEEASQVKTRAEEIRLLLNKAQEKAAEQKIRVSEEEAKAQEAQKLVAELDLVNNSLKHTMQSLDNVTSEHKQIQAQLHMLYQELQPVQALEELRASLASKQSQLIDVETKLKQANTLITELVTKKSLSENLKSKIESLQNCPTCLQSVTPDHKHSIISVENQKLNHLDKIIADNSTNKRASEDLLISLKQEINQLITHEQQALLSNAKRKTYEEKNNRLNLLQQNKLEITNRISDLQKNKEILSQKTETHDFTEKFRMARQKLDALQNEERQLAIDYNKLAKEIEGIELYSNSIEEEIAQKEQAKKELDALAIQQYWLQEHFMNLMDVMEKHVLSRVHNEFNDLFQRWFSILIEDDLLNARLDDSFTPVMTQNGHEVSVSNLSGGEKTACALAYRLALNKVINDVVSTIKTKDILILDEPTDGFSDEQLDKIRDVLDELKLRQVILVSHENKIESMVQNVIRIEKQGHVSSVSTT